MNFKKSFDSAWNKLIKNYKNFQKDKEGYYMLWNEADMNAEFRKYLDEQLSNRLIIHSNITKTYLLGYEDKDPNPWWKGLDMKYRTDFDILIANIQDKVYAVAELKYPHHGRETKKSFLSKLKKRIRLLNSVPRECYSALLIIDAYFHRNGLKIKSEVKNLVRGTKVKLYYYDG